MVNDCRAQTECVLFPLGGSMKVSELLVWPRFELLTKLCLSNSFFPRTNTRLSEDEQGDSAKTKVSKGLRTPGSKLAAWA